MNKRVKQIMIAGAIALLFVILLGNSAYVVREDEVATVNRMGRVARVAISPLDRELVEAGFSARALSVDVKTSKGLSFKMPFEKRIEIIQRKKGDMIYDSFR